MNRLAVGERLMNMKAKTSKSATDATVSADTIANPRPPFAEALNALDGAGDFLQRPATGRARTAQMGEHDGHHIGG